MQFDLAVVGLGYVGLPLAVEASRVGLSVLGYDVSERVVDDLGSGRSHVDDVSDQELQKALAEGLVLTPDDQLLAEASAVAICVPTPLTDHQPDLAAVKAATATVAKRLRVGQLVVLESTTYPGTTEEIVVPILEDESQLQAGVDFSVAYSPERIDPGNIDWSLTNTPKIVGGIDATSTERAAALYRKFVSELVLVSGTREAEMAKLLENTYRHVNIALVNEMAIFCRELGIDIWEVIDAASTKPFGFQAFYPGPGVGGHCVPVDPNYLSYRVRQLGYQFRFVELAQEINARMPNYVVQRAAAILNREAKALNGSLVHMLGVSYKANVSDVREAPAIEVCRLLQSQGARVTFSDPHVADFGIDDVERIDDPVLGAKLADLVILLTPHAEFDLPAIGAVAHALLDTRGVADRTVWEAL